MPTDVLVVIARFAVVICTIVTTIVAIRKPVLRNKIEVRFIFRSEPKDDKNDDHTPTDKNSSDEK